MYRHYAEVQGAAVRAVPTDPARNFEPDAEALLAACDDETRLVFLCSPNNPTGTQLPNATLTRILGARGERSVVVVDEAYIEFSTATSMVESLDDWPNLVVLRTLSKALACAGARCGAVMGPREVIDMMNAIQAPYALSTPVVESVEDALTERWLGEATRRVAEIVAERERVRRTLDKHPVVTQVWPSAANFLLVEVRDVERVMSASREGRILLRYFGGELERCIRISIGTVEENDALLAVFADLGAD
jgi:histidinol-phosphate aminotransferase